MELLSRVEFDYFVNLSGQCYPIKPALAIKQKLESNSETFMQVRRYPEEEPIKHKVARFTDWHANLAVGNWRHTFVVKNLRPELPLGMIPFGGSQWFCMRRRHVRYILEFLTEHPVVRRFFEHVGIPDESFFQTILMNSPYRTEVTNTNLRYVAWSPVSLDGHAYEEGDTRFLTMQDYPALLRSDSLWARKFDTQVDGALLDKIDKECLGWLP